MAQEAENGFGNPPQVPESWGFHILTAINNLRVELETKLDRQAGELRQEIRQEIGRLEGKIDTLHYWAIGTIVAVILAAGTIIVTLR